MNQTVIKGNKVKLVEADETHLERLTQIRATEQVKAAWRGQDYESETLDSINDSDINFFAILDSEENVVGAIQFAEEDEDPDYRHANIDIYIDPAKHRNGFGSEAIRLLAAYIFHELGHHRIAIDPAANNHFAIECYTKVGFKPVGLMRQYERGADGTWHDGLLMDLLKDDFI